MSKVSNLYEAAGGSSFEGYFILKVDGHGIPPSWIERYRDIRLEKQLAVLKTMKSGEWNSLEVIRDWEEAFRKEQFYYGVQVLLDVDRNGETVL